MITFENVSKKYTKELFRPTPSALSDISFNLQQGSTLGLIGANGAGKSTAIRLMMDFIRPDKGTIKLFNRPASDLSKRNEIGYLPEIANFPANLNILDLISFTAVTCGLPKSIEKERGKQLLQDLGLWEARSKRLNFYSKGMQQRANFVLALINDPQLLILDEPMSGLDPLGREQIIRLIGKLKAEGKTILFCSHILNDVDRLVDQLLVLHKGEMVFFGKPREFLMQEGTATIEEAFVRRISSITPNEEYYGS